MDRSLRFCILGAFTRRAGHPRRLGLPGELLEDERGVAGAGVIYEVILFSFSLNMNFILCYMLVGNESQGLTLLEVLGE